MSSDSVETRTRILEASLSLLEASGGQGVRMSDIASQAGISRQAVYLHFPSRAELLIETTYYLDRLKKTDDRLAASRTAKTGAERLDAYIRAWSAYIPEIYGVAKALLAMRETDAAAREAWDQRMADMREGCEAAIRALDRDGRLAGALGVEPATDLLWTMLSVRTWEQLTQTCGWSQARYLETMTSTARRLFVSDAPSA